MSFDAAWLDLREPADRAARDSRLLAAAGAWLANVAAPLALDLGAGAGAMPRALAPFAPPGLRWRLVDNDPRLLALAAARTPGAETLRMDLAELDALPTDGVRLVTASALLDLVSEVWIEALADRLVAAGMAVLATLSYDGQLAWEPSAAEDAPTASAFNRHQRRDKGFGPALGPDAAAALATALRRRGYAVRLAPSPWRLGTEQAELIAALAAGIAEAAAEEECALAPAWGQARRAARGCIVGHIDLFAVPQATSAQSNTTSLSRP
jgi:SAM-dependent methyltransferase